MYTLIVSVDYEGSDLLGLYSSAETAIAAAQRYIEADQHWGDVMEVALMELDAEAQFQAGTVVWSFRR